MGKSKTNVEKIRQTIKLGDKPVAEVVLGMLIKLEEVYSHPIRLEVDNKGSPQSLTWTRDEDWAQLKVPYLHLVEVAGLQFQPIVPMSGENQVTKLWIQTLPVLDKEGEICDLHIALSLTGWPHWFAYTGGNKGETKSQELVAWPALHPVVAFIEIRQQSRL